MTDMTAWTFILLWVALPPLLAAAMIAVRHLARHAAMPAPRWTGRPAPRLRPVAAG